MNTISESPIDNNEKLRKFLKKEYRQDSVINVIDEANDNRIVYDKMQGRPSVTMIIENTKIECLLDTGARINVMDESIIRKLGLTIEPTEERLRCANNSKLDTLGKTSIKTTIGNIAKMITFIVVKEVIPQVIGGIELQKQFGIRLKWEKERNEAEGEEYMCKIEARYGQQTTDEDRLKRAEECIEITDKVIKEIIRRNKGVFMADKWDIGCTKLIKHEIVTKGAAIKMKPRRQPVNLEEKIENAIKNLWENQIIRKCNSPWNTPLVCVWKKEKQDIRLCLDFRQLNLVTERQAFPMPNVDEMLDALYDTKYFSSIDLGNAYYQVELEETSQEKTAFSTKTGQFCFNRMPFGIAAAPGTFQELMTKVLEGMQNKGTTVYLDDILIYSKTIE